MGNLKHDSSNNILFSARRHDWTGAVVVSILACAALSGTALAEDYPDRPIRVIVSNGPGSAVDSTARMVGQRLTELWGKQVVIDNRAGAGGVIAHELAAQAPKDGYTLLFSTSAGLVINPLLLKLSYDPPRDFAPISLAVVNPQMLVAFPGVGVTSVAQLLALAKQKPGKLNCGSTGNGTSNHLACEMLKSMGNVNFVHVPYKSTGAAITATVAGEVDFMWNSMPPIYPLTKAGKLRALGVGGKKRVAAAPDVPTIAETIPGFECLNWYAMLAPKGTPQPVIAKLNAEMVKMFKDPAFAQKLAEQGSEPQTTTPAGLADWMRQDSERWSKIIKQAGVKIQ